MSIRSAGNYQRVFDNINKIAQRNYSSSFMKDNNSDVQKNLKNKLHVSAKQDYPVAAALQLPANIDPSESTRFSPQRSREISATVILSHHLSLPKIDVTVDQSSTVTDPHVASYDCFGAVSLNSVMQSNVPNPFGGMHKFSHLNMPGGQWSQEGKFISQNLHSSHYTNLRRAARADWGEYDQDATLDKGRYNFAKITIKTPELLQLLPVSNMHAQSTIRLFSTQSKPSVGSSIEEKADPTLTPAGTVVLSKKEQLKKAFKEYGATVIVFHVAISLVSLEICYLLVSGGIDLMPIIESLGLASTVLANKIATGASTFVIAYAIHKVFAPIRISITLASTPFIVRYLRKRGFLKSKPTKT